MPVVLEQRICITALPVLLDPADRVALGRLAELFAGRRASRARSRGASSPSRRRYASARSPTQRSLRSQRRAATAGSFASVLLSFGRQFEK